MRAVRGKLYYIFFLISKPYFIEETLETIQDMHNSWWQLFPIIFTIVLSIPNATVFLKKILN